MNDMVQGEVATETGTTAADCLARARSLILLLRAAAPRIETQYSCRRMSWMPCMAPVCSACCCRVPMAGISCGPRTVRCVEAIAEGDPSTAWCMNQGSGCSMAAAYLSPAIAHGVWDDPRAVLAWGQGPGARAVRAEGGWKVTGTWTFVSGAHHATWLGAMAPCFEADGTPILRPDGKPWERTMLIRQDQTRLLEAWKVMGLRGTGSDTYKLDGLFVDDAHSLTREYQPERRIEDTLYRFQSMQLYAGGFASVALGNARALVDAVIELVKGKTQAWATEPLRDNQAVQHVIGYSDGALKAARAGLHKVLDDVWDDVAPPGRSPSRTGWRSARPRPSPSIRPATRFTTCITRPDRPRFSTASRSSAGCGT